MKTSAPARARFVIRWIVPLLLAFAGTALAEDAAVRPVDAGAARRRVTPPPVAEARRDVIKPAGAAEFLVDAAKIAPAPTAGTPTRAAAIVATDLQGRALPVETRAGGMVSVAPSPGQWVIVKPETTPVLRMAKGLQWFSSVCVPPATEAGRPPQDSLGSYTEFETVPVAWSTNVDAYLLRARIGVAKNGDPLVDGPIGKTASVRLSLLGVNNVGPVEFALERLGINGEQEVELVFDRTTTPEPRLVVRSTVAAEQPFALDVLPRVDVQPRRSPILGLGLEETVVSVECVQPYGGLFRLEDAVPVEITTSGGREADADRLVLTSAAPNARFRFRSVGLGQAQIVATARTVRQEIVGSVTIEQALPWAQLLAALLGGALGGFSRRFLKGARARTSARRVLEGTIVGLVAFVAGVLGVGYLSLPSAIVATVAGAFLTGVIAGFAGVTVLERLSRKTVAADG